MRFTIQHVTPRRVRQPDHESVMEARMQPRSDGTQRCLRFWLSTTPASRVLMYQDHDGSTTCRPWASSGNTSVCQDCAHIFIALARQLGVPARYVSGYLFHQADIADRSIDGATHAWAEVLLPELGWVGIDPTNDLVTGERHVRVAVGRDYADVPPTRGVYKGNSGVNSELAVSVVVGPASVEVGSEALPFVPWLSQEAAPPADSQNHQQQQQQ